MERIQVLMPASFEEGEAIGNVLFETYGGKPPVGR